MERVLRMRTLCGPLSGCNGCGKELRGRRTAWCSNKCRDSVVENHLYTIARARTKKRDGYKCTRCGSKKRLESNHVVPVNGRRETWGCSNHQQNLETLCHTCHQKETAHQRSKGLIGGKRHKWTWMYGGRVCKVCRKRRPRTGSAGPCGGSGKLDKYPDRRVD